MLDLSKCELKRLNPDEVTEFFSKPENCIGSAPPSVRFCLTTERGCEYELNFMNLLDESCDTTDDVIFHCPAAFRMKTPNEPFNPLLGWKFHEIAADLELDRAGIEARFVFGTCWVEEDDINGWDEWHFAIISPRFATHMIVLFRNDIRTPIFKEFQLKNGLAETGFRDVYASFEHFFGGYQAIALPIGCYLPSPGDDDAAARSFAQEADTYRESCARTLGYPENEVFFPGRDLILTAAMEALDRFKWDDSDETRALAKKYLDQAIGLLNERRRAAGCHPEHQLWTDEKNPFLINYGSVGMYDALDQAIEATEKFEILHAAQREFGPKFLKFEKDVRSLYGRLLVKTEAVGLELRRAKFSPDQKPYRLTWYALDENGLAAFVADLRNEKAQSAEAHQTNELALQRQS